MLKQTKKEYNKKTRKQIHMEDLNKQKPLTTPPNAKRKTKSAHTNKNK